MSWEVIFHPAFEAELPSLPQFVLDALEPRIDSLRQYGPSLGRPYADTLRESRHSNMKELRLSTLRGVWRVAFAFDVRRRAVVLVAGDKQGEKSRSFYRQFIRDADNRFDDHLAGLRG